MSKQSFTTGQVLTAAQVNSLQANDFNQTVSVKTANYTLAAADKGTRIEFNTSGSVTCTVNSGLFDAGDTLVIQNRGAGTATITAGTATVNTSASLALAQYSAGTLYFVSDSAAIFFGDAAGISASIVDAKGDLIVGTADNTVGRLAVGTNGYTLVADSSTATGLAYAAPAAGGKVLQVVFFEYNATVTSTSATFATTNVTATITPAAATSKIAIFGQFTAAINHNATGYHGIKLRLVRGATVIEKVGNHLLSVNDVAGLKTGMLNAVYYDSPNTTSATTYKFEYALGGSGTAYINPEGSGTDTSSILLMEIGA